MNSYQDMSSWIFYLVHTQVFRPFLTIIIDIKKSVIEEILIGNVTNNEMQP